MRLATLIITLLLMVGFSSSAQAHHGSDCWGCAPARVKAQAEREIYRQFGHGWRGRVARCIAYHESGLNPQASNWRDSNGGSHGLFQMNGIHKGWVNFTKLEHNIRYAVQIAYRMSRGGNRWWPWTTAGSCL